MMAAGGDHEGGYPSPSSGPADSQGAQGPTQAGRSLVSRRIGWLLLGYFLVRILLVNFLQLQGSIEIGLSASALEFGMYALIAAMFAVARTSLHRFKIDRLSLILFVIFGVVVTVPSAAGGGTALELMYCAFGLIAPVLVVVIVRARHSLGRWAPTNLNWLGLGLGSAVALRLVVSALDSIVTGRELPVQSAGPMTAGGLFAVFLTFMGNSAVLEEPAFRGFFWGYLEDLRWKPVWIWLLQAALFWLAHLRYIDRPYTFWVALPAAGLLLGWLSWKSRSVSTSLLAHAAYNTVGAFF